MTRINTNVESLRGLRNVQKANSLLNTSLQRLSTGIKINNGRDNPSGLIASEALRLQITTIEQSIKNSNRANNVIGTADSALGEIGGLINQVRGLVQEGLNVGALSQEETEANQAQIDAALSAINRISANTTFAGDKLIDGSKAFTTSLTTSDLGKLSDYRINEAVFGTRTSIEIDATVNTVAEKAQLRYTAGNLTGAVTVEVGGSKGNQTLFLGGSSTVQNVRDAVNDVTDATGVSARILDSTSQTIAATPFVAQVNNSATIGAGNAALTFTDDRTLPATGTFSIVIDGVGVSQAAGVVTGAADGNGNRTITVSLATDANGAVTSTATAIAALVNADANASPLITVTAGGTGAGNPADTASTALTGGSAAVAAVAEGTITYVDNRDSDALGNLSLVVDGTGASQTAGIVVGAADGNGNRTITLTLATDANGVVTTTLDDIQTLIENDTTAAEYLDVLVTGDGDALGDDLASTTLAEPASGGVLALESDDYGAAEFVNVNVLEGSFLTYASDSSTYTTRDNGTDIDVTINGQSAEGKGLQATIKTSSLDASVSFETAYNVADANAVVTITGGGSLFQIGQEATAAGQIGVGIEAVNTARLGGITGKLYELGTGGGKSLLDVRNSLLGAGPQVTQSDLVSILEEASNRVSSLRGRLGALQKNVIETNISTLGVALENITEARSQIVDTDFAEETAQLQKAQILSQAGLSVLGIANQNPQQVLSLLR
jgi:flagellin